MTSGAVLKALASFAAAATGFKICGLSHHILTLHSGKNGAGPDVIVVPIISMEQYNVF